MPPEERSRFYWEPEKLDWRTWMYDVHLPGLEKWVFPLVDEKLKRDLKPLRRYDTLIDLLEEMGCEIGQGYLFSRPLPYERLEAWFAAQTEPESTPTGEVRRLRAVI